VWKIEEKTIRLLVMTAVANCSIYFYLFYYQNSNPATKALNLQKTFLGSFTENRKHFGGINYCWYIGNMVFKNGDGLEQSFFASFINIYYNLNIKTAVVLRSFHE
jgi:hypothetical protein